MSLRTFALMVMALWLAGAALSDLRSLRIANRWLLVGTGMALVLHGLAMTSDAQALAGHSWSAPLAGALLGLLLLLPLYLLGAMGAADIKLMAMVGAFLGTKGVATAVLYSLLAGGLLSLVYLNGAGVLPRLLANLRTLHRAGPDGTTPLSRSAARLPYAVAIALGSVAALVWPLGR